jgi:dihydrodipicolinate synthase/N-acetylneuraminate lyase
LCAIYRHRSGVAGMKTAACLLGLCRPTVCAPFESLTEEQVEAVRRTLAETGLLTGEAALV